MRDSLLSPYRMGCIVKLGILHLSEQLMEINQLQITRRLNLK